MTNLHGFFKSLNHPTRCVTAIKLRHGHDCGGDFSRPVNKQAIAQSATKVAPTSVIILSNPLNLMAVTRCVGMQYQRTALRNSPQRGLPEFPRSAWELDISLGIFVVFVPFVDEMIFPG